MRVRRKPGRVLDRICRGDFPDEQYFPSARQKAILFAMKAEAPSCWQRVLDGVMTNNRFDERMDRMKNAILRVTTGGEA